MTEKILQAGTPLLRHTSQPVPLDEIQGDKVQDLIRRMWQALKVRGTALSAVQLGDLRQVVVIEDQREVSSTERIFLNRQPVKPYVLINPVLNVVDETPVEHFEGCLSFLDEDQDPYFMVVPRATSVRVTGYNERAEEVQIEATGWHARILQHEVDHLAGRICVDRATTRTMTTYRNYLELWKGREIVEAKQEFGCGND